MSEPYLESLKEYGLSANEITIYLTSLRIGEATAQTIAKNALLPRTTTYHLLESLIQKSLISFILKDTIKYFQATHPKKLLEQLDDKRRLIQASIPQLTALASTFGQKPNVSIFEGTRGIRSILEDVLEEKNIIYHYGDILSLQQSLPYIFPQFIRKRIEKKINIKILCKKEEAHIDLLKSAKQEYRQFVFIPPSYTFASSIFIYAHKVVILSLKQQPYYGILIENKDFYTTQINLFELLWKAYIVADINK